MLFCSNSWGHVDFCARPARFEKMRDPGGIIWIASYPRSGNSWVRHFLASLCAKITFQNTLRWCPWEIAAGHFELVLGRPVTQATRQEIAAARPLVQARIADEANGRLFVKTHNALLIDRGHPLINTEITAGAIYIVRNPLDVAVSFAHHFGMSLDSAIDRMAAIGEETDISEHVVHEVYSSWSDHVHSWTRVPHPALFVIRYEDMLDNPSASANSLCRFLRIEAPPEELQSAVEQSSFAFLSLLELRNGYDERPSTSKAFFRDGRANQWRSVLRPAQVKRVVDSHKEQMDRFAYLP